MSKEINPFVKDLVINVGGKVVDYYTYIKDKSNYDLQGNPPTVYLEREEKVYFYTRRKKSLRAKLGKLSGSAAQLLLWIICSINYGEDFIRFTDKEFLDDTGVSYYTLRNAKKELIENDIIAKFESRSKFYWINPSVIFKGSRVKKFPDNINIYRSKNKTNSTSNTKVN